MLNVSNPNRIINEAAYATATKARIIANAQKTFCKTYEDAAEVLEFIASGRNHESMDVTYTDNFVGSLAKAFDTFGKLTPKQVEAVRKCIAARAARRAEWAAKDAALNASREWIGTVGEKVVLTLTLKKRVELDGNYGVSYILILEDASRNDVIYKGTSNAMTYTEGETVTVKATIKDHGTRNGVKQTVIQRPSKA